MHIVGMFMPCWGACRAEVKSCESQQVKPKRMKVTGRAWLIAAVETGSKRHGARGGLGGVQKAKCQAVPTLH